MLRLLTLSLLLAACGSEEPAWMASLDDTQSLSALSIPGTHDSGALFEPLAGLARCQDLTIADQLAAGVRYFDLRCRHFDDGFLIYHGAIDQNQSFDDVLATMYGFLDAHPTETILASVKEEAAPQGATRPFDATFLDYVSRDPDRWHLDPGVPALGDVRGKLVLVRRFDTTTASLGIPATDWPDNATFTSGVLRVQDEYQVTDNDAKWTAVQALLAAARVDTSTGALFLDYTSGFQLVDGLSNITLVSDDINRRLDDELGATDGPAHLGVLVMDHVTAARVQAVIATNTP